MPKRVYAPDRVPADYTGDFTYEITGVVEDDPPQEEEEEVLPANAVVLEELEPGEMRGPGEAIVDIFTQRSHEYVIRPWRDVYPDQPFCPHLKNHNIINYLEEFTFTMPHQFYVDFYANREQLNRLRRTETIIRQIKASEKMLKFSGSTQHTCDDRAIKKGDKVRIKMEAYIRRPSDVRDVAQYNRQITELDGSPAWTNKVFTVLSHDEDADEYVLDGVRKGGRTVGPLSVWRKRDICKFGQVKVGDIVRVSMGHTKKYRKHLTSKVIGYLDGLLLLHKFTRSLFMVTHLKDGDPTPDGHTPPGIFLNTVFAIGHRLEGNSPLYKTLVWETDENIAEPGQNNPHSAAFYDYQQKHLSAIPQKDLFRGFQEWDLLHVDKQTQNLFWDPTKDGDPHRYLNLSHTFRYFNDSEQIYCTGAGCDRGPEVGVGVRDYRGYPTLSKAHPFLRSPLARYDFMKDRALDYYRCLIRLRDKGKAATVRSSKRQRYNEPFTKDVCVSQAKFAKFLRSYAFN